jgi:NTP pyrophosphatase (non-canonical NTP hydrolase)
MTFDEYQKKAAETLIRHDDPMVSKTILALGVAGEAGEVADKWKKLLVYWNSELSEERKADLGKELADVVWYVAVMAEELGLSLDELMRQNLEKIADRQSRGVLKGSGDNR